MTVDPITLENRRFKLSLSGEIGPCPRCDEHGRIACDACDGTGSDPCGECGEYKACKRCCGTGRQRCPDCEGTRLALADERPPPRARDECTLGLPFPPVRR